MVDSLKNNFLLLPAVTLAVLLYAFIPVKDQKPADFLFKSQDVSWIECRLLSCPVKVGKERKSYMVKAKLIKVGKNDGGVSSASGAAQIILRWHLQDGHIAIPGSSNQNHIQENVELFDFELTIEEMANLRALNENSAFFPGMGATSKETQEMFEQWAEEWGININ